MADTGELAPENGPPVAEADAPKAEEKFGVWNGKHYPTAADFPDGDCRVREGSSLVADPADPAWKWVVDNCQFDKGVKIVLAAAPATKRLPKKVAQPEESPVEPVVAEVPQPQPQPEPLVLLASNETAPAAPEIAAPARVVESVGVDAAIGQVKSLLPADASAGVLVGGAAALAVVGAAIKLGPSMLKARAEKASQEHEREMRKLEIEEKKAEQGEDQHKQCGMARMALEAKVMEQAGQIASLSAKLSEVESKASAKSESSIDLEGFDPGEMQERLEALEKLLKKQAPAPAKKGKAKKA